MVLIDGEFYDFDKIWIVVIIVCVIGIMFIVVGIGVMFGFLVVIELNVIIGNLL